jgi:hypothetical protein
MRMDASYDATGHIFHGQLKNEHHKHITVSSSMMIVNSSIADSWQLTVHRWKVYNPAREVVVHG